MPIDTIVGDPEAIEKLEEAEECTSRIVDYEKENNCNAGVLLIQRRLFCGYHEIVSEKEARRMMNRPVRKNTPEWGIQYWPRSYFENLRKKLANSKEEPPYK